MTDLLKTHNADIDRVDRSRILHQIVRGFNDGECPKCHHLSSAIQVRQPLFNGDLCCPKCKYTIPDAIVQAAIREFSEVLEKNFFIFEDWSKSLDESIKYRQEDSVDSDLPF